MDNSLIKVFASEEYLLLRWLAQHPTQTSNAAVVKFSQNELAQSMSLKSLAKIFLMKLNMK